MRRREFITLLGSAGVAWPLAAHAQQQPMPVIGFLNPTSPDASADRLCGFRQGLKDSGYIDGENAAIIYSWAEDHNADTARMLGIPRQLHAPERPWGAHGAPPGWQVVLGGRSTMDRCSERGRRAVHALWLRMPHEFHCCCWR